MWQTFTNFMTKLCVPDTEALDAAQQYFRTVHMPKGTYFVREGAVCTRLAFIYQGLFRSFYVNDKGVEVTYCFAREGGIGTSFESFISGRTSALSIVTMEDTVLLEINKSDLDKLLSKHLFWNQVSRVLTEQEYLKMTQHADESKTGTAWEKYRKLMAQQPDLLQRVPLHHIASYLGISGRHLTRMRTAIAGR